MWDEHTESETIIKRLYRADAQRLLLQSALEQTELQHSNQVLRGRLWIDACEGNHPHILAERRVTAVVSMGTVSVREAWYPEHDGIHYHRILIQDADDADILQYLDEACKFIHYHIQSGTAVLVHCQAGISRSATVCIAYLIRYHHLSLVAAHGVVKAAREIICPNAGFLKQLQQWEVQHVEEMK